MQHFDQLGRDGYDQARRMWMKTGLSFKQRKSIGLCIQRLLEEVDPLLREQAPGKLGAHFELSNTDCRLVLSKHKGCYASRVMPVM